MAYSQKVVDKFEETLNNPEKASVGRWKPGDEDFHRVGTGIVGAPACGDVMKLQIKCKNIDGVNRIVDARFKTYGCGSAIASSGQLIDMLKGKTLEEAQAISNQEIVDILELPSIKIHCSVLAEEAIHRAIDDFKSLRTND
ncbi:MAG: iron-binding protein [Gammaproteobacteria bacterium]|nr:iron-binding protein [Gammaproteobacteria bacterium]|tara:strand:+ start:644 stop:1066 length:423 start_codon:yes stop_codon:yes gene_type:complete